ncbi:hypothetical protein ACWEO4_47680 [Streptomyces sp. NPDC004393]
MRGYRILNRGGRAAYGATVGLPANIRRARAGGSRYAQDARQQVRVWGNTVREDGRAWADTGRHVSRVMREHTDDRGGMGPFHSRRLPAAAAPATTRGAGTPSAPRTPAGRPGTAAARAGTPPSPAGGHTPAADPGPWPWPGPGYTPPRTGGAPGTADRPVLPGGQSARGGARDEARARMQELLRRTAPEAERLRRERARRRDEGGESE